MLTWEEWSSGCPFGFLVLAVVVNQQPLSHPAARAGVASASRGGSPMSWSGSDGERKGTEGSGGRHGTERRQTGERGLWREGRRPLEVRRALVMVEISAPL